MMLLDARGLIVEKVYYTLIVTKSSIPPGMMGCYKTPPYTLQLRMGDLVLNELTPYENKIQFLKAAPKIIEVINNRLVEMRDSISQYFYESQIK